MYPKLVTLSHPNSLVPFPEARGAKTSGGAGRQAQDPTYVCARVLSPEGNHGPPYAKTHSAFFSLDPSIVRRPPPEDAPGAGFSSAAWGVGGEGGGSSRRFGRTFP